MGSATSLRLAELGLALLVVAGMVAVWLKVLGQPRDPGRRGERRVGLSLAGLDTAVVAANLRFTDGRHPVEIDHLVVGRDRLVVVETKHWSGRLVPGPGDWLVEGRSGPRFVEAPPHQAARHVRSLKRYLRRRECPWAEWPIHACVVLAGPAALAPGPLPEDVPILSVDGLLPHLRRLLGEGPALTREERAERLAWLARLGASPPGRAPSAP